MDWEEVGSSLLRYTSCAKVESAVTGKAMPLKASLSSCKSLEEFEKLITCRGQRHVSNS